MGGPTATAELRPCVRPPAGWLQAAGRDRSDGQRRTTAAGGSDGWRRIQQNSAQGPSAMPSAAIGRSCTEAWPPSIIFLGTIVFQALGNRASPNHRAAVAEQCGRSRFPKAMRESPLLGQPPQKSQYRGAPTPQALLGGIFGRYTPKRNGYICSPPPGHCTGAV